MSAPSRATAPAQPTRIRGIGVMRWALARLRTTNPGLLLIVAAGSVFTAYFAVRVTQWVVMTDELQYEKLAISFGDTLSPIPNIRGHYISSLAQLYPILTAPVYQLFAMPTAFRVVHGLNAAIMASTAIPAYLLAREVTSSRRAAYLVAALTVAVPWMAMSTMILTEVAAYPTFVWAMLAVQRALVEPSLRRDLVAVASLGLAFLARTQFLLLAPLFPLAIVVHEVGYSLATSGGDPLRARFETGLRSAARNHPQLLIASALAALAAPLLVAAGVLDKLLGSYALAVHRGGLLPAGLLKTSAVHLDFVAVGIGILPFVLAAAWGFGSLVRPSSRRDHAYAVLLVIAVGALTLETASFNLRFGIAGSIQDRYLFYVAPLLFVGMAACLLDQRPRWLGVAVAGAAFAWMATLANWAPFGLPFFESPDYVFHSVLDGQSYHLAQILGLHDLSPKVTVVVGTIVISGASAAAIRKANRERTLAVAGLVVLAFCIAESTYVLHKIVDGIRHGAAAAELKGRNWIDRSLPEGAHTAVVVSPINSNPDGRPHWLLPGETAAAWLDTEFWNRAVDRAFLYRDFGDYAPFYNGKLSLDFTTGRARFSDPVQYLAVSASDVRMRFAASLVKSNPNGVDLLRPESPYRVTWATLGLPPDGWSPAGRPVRLRLYPGGGRKGDERSLSIWFQSSPDIPRVRSYSVRVGSNSISGTVEPKARRQETFRACVPPRRPLDAEIRIAGRTRLPSGPEVGLRITRIQISPTGRAC